MAIKSSDHISDHAIHKQLNHDFCWLVLYNTQLVSGVKIAIIIYCMGNVLTVNIFKRN